METKNIQKLNDLNWEHFVRLLSPIILHMAHVRCVNSFVKIEMLEPDFGSILFVITMSLVLQQFNTVIFHDVYRTDIQFLATIQEVVTLNIIFDIKKLKNYI